MVHVTTLAHSDAAPARRDEPIAIPRGLRGVGGEATVGRCEWRKSSRSARAALVEHALLDDLVGLEECPRDRQAENPETGRIGRLAVLSNPVALPARIYSC
jgi:hypothetical protein